MTTLWKILTRKKTIDPLRAEESSLARVLNTFDLTALGVGSTLGVGMYVLVGKVAKETAGPSVVLSFLIAAIASTFAGLCYAEFGARTPRAGSAYIYSYVCVGEFIAFIIGWNLILEYIIGSASVARGMSLYIDALLNDTLKNTFIDIAPINVSFLSPYFDFLTFGIAIILSIGLAFGMKESSKVNNVFTVLNIFVVLFVIIAGSTKADTANWDLEVPPDVHDAGTGGFFPFGVSGMIKGAATCFYGFVGFDCIATTGEEVKNPQKAIPFAIVVSLLIVFLAYFGTATVVTLMVPYYLQDVNSPIPHAFEEFGWEAAKWIVTIGGIFALCASLFGAMFPLPRIIYAMATDGLVFRFLGKVSTRFSTPVIGTLLAGLFTGLMGAIFEQGQLVDMMSIGTLLAYTIVAACVLLLRYSVDEDEYTLLHSESETSLDAYTDSRDVNPLTEDNSLLDDDPHRSVTIGRLLRQFFNFGRVDNPSKTSETLVAIQVCFFCVLSILLGLCFMYLIDDIKRGMVYAIVLPSVVGFLMIVTLMSIGSQPNSKRVLPFRVPLVPLIPALSILVNIYLMLSLDVSTWIRFGVWMAIGLPIYFYSAHYYHKDAPLTKSLTDQTYVNYGYVNEDKRNSIDSDSAYYEDSGESKGSIKYSDIAISPPDEKIEETYVNNNVYNNYVDEDVSKEKVIGIIHREDGKIVEIVEDNKNENYANIIDTYSVEVSENSEDLIFNVPASDEAIEELERIIQYEEDKLAESPDIKSTEKVMEELDIVIDTEQNKINEDDVIGKLEDMIESEENKINESDSKVEEIEINLPPPPPPPIENFEKFKLPRVTSRTKYIKAKKPAPKIPPVDYSRKNSVVEEGPTDNLKIGSTLHRNFLQKLDSVFQKTLILEPPNQIYTEKKLPIEDKKTIDVPRKFSEANDDPEDIKAKLNKLLTSVSAQFIKQSEIKKAENNGDKD